MPASALLRRALLASSLTAGALAACGGQTTGTASDAGGDTQSPIGTDAGNGYADGGPIHFDSGLPDSGPPPFDAGPPQDGGSVFDGNSGLPSNPGGPAPTGTGSTVLAFSTLYFGDTDRSGVTNPDAWKSYGLDIDGKVTTRTSTDVCTLAPGAAKNSQVDGFNGIDNSFGENILPIIITTAGSDFAARINTAITGGGPTTMVRIDQLGTGADYAPLSASIYHAAPSASAPLWNGTDVRAVDSQSVAGGDVQKPLLTFPSSYMTQRVWVGAPPSGLANLDVSIFSVPGSPGIPVTHLLMEMTIDPSNGKATMGTISGILPTQPFVAYLQKVAGSISTSLCSGSAFQSIAQQIEQAQDIMSDGSNQPGAACDAISIGMGFDATAVQLGSVTTLAPTPNPCGDGG